MLRQETICRLVFCLLVFVLQIFCWVNFTVLIFYINHIIQILCQFLNLFLFEGILHGYLSLFVHTVFSVWYDFKAELSVTGFCAWSQGIYVEHLPKKKKTGKTNQNNNYYWICFSVFPTYSWEWFTETLIFLCTL